MHLFFYVDFFFLGTKREIVCSKDRYEHPGHGYIAPFQAEGKEAWTAAQGLGPTRSGIQVLHSPSCAS